MKNVMNFINIFQNYKIFNRLNVDSMCLLGEKSTYDAGKHILYKVYFPAFLFERMVEKLSKII